MKTSACLLVVTGALALGCSSETQPAADSQGDDVTSTQYVSIVDFSDATYQDVWYDIQGKLAGEFADVCGDTFCEGDFSNLTPLSLGCAVSSKLGSVKDCAWTFAGSIESVDPATSAITVDAPTFQCHFHPKTTASKLTALLSGSADAIHETLPGTTGSIYDALGDCFAHPIGATPISFPDNPAPTYVEASDYYTTSANQAKWASAKAALKLGFDNVCGDTFCGGDFGDLQSLAFVCSITKSSGKVKSCDWVFGGSYSLVDASSGAVKETSQSWTCPVAVKGTLSQLITTLNAPTVPGGPDPIRRPLPGETTTAYDALLGCLP